MRKKERKLPNMEEKIHREKREFISGNAIQHRSRKRGETVFDRSRNGHHIRSFKFKRRKRNSVDFIFRKSRSVESLLI